MKVFVFGNPLVEKDSLPLKLLAKLRKHFPDIEFVSADPTEMLEYNNDIWIMDAADGIEDVTILDDISKFDLPARFSVHDYDLALDLQLLEKIGKLRKVKIIAIPALMSKEEALKKVAKLLTTS